MKAKAIYGDDIGTIVRHYKGPYFKFASRNFYAEFIAAREVANNPKKYFPEGVRFHAPLSEDRLVLRHSLPAYHLASHYGVSGYRLADLNMHWRTPARDGRANLPAGSTVWLPGGTLERVAVAPYPVRSMAARTEPDYQPAKAEKAKVKARPIKVAEAQSKAKSVESRKTASSGAAKIHVVKPKETLYRVATYYELSVEELRRLNRMGPKDTHIRPGQRLRVSG